MQGMAFQKNLFFLFVSLYFLFFFPGIITYL